MSVSPGQKALQEHLNNLFIKIDNTNTSHCPSHYSGYTESLVACSAHNASACGTHRTTHCGGHNSTAKGTQHTNHYASLYTTDHAGAQTANRSHYGSYDGSDYSSNHGSNKIGDKNGQYSSANPSYYGSDTGCSANYSTQRASDRGSNNVDRNPHRGYRSGTG